MRKSIPVAAAIAAASVTFAQASLLLTGSIDGPRTGGLPKAIELYATADIPDLSIYGVEAANNGAPFAGPEFTLSGSATAGSYIYIASESPHFTAYFGFAPTFVNAVAGNNGNDALGLYLSGLLVDVLGDASEISSPDDIIASWAHQDSYIYRNDGAAASLMFNAADWNVPGNNLLDAQGSSGVNGSAGITVPFGTYVPEPATLALLGVGSLALAHRRGR